MHCRIYLPTALSELQSVAIDKEQTKYLGQVMRLQSGDEITVFNGLGGEFLAKINHLSKGGGECSLTEYVDVNRELSCRVHIIQAANRSEKIETVLQKSTEMGAASFQIVNSERATLNVPSHKREKRLARWQKIILEAAEQSERTAMPTVEWHDKLAHINQVGESFVLHPRDAMLWGDARERLRQANEITLAIGPEGGWSNQELEYLATQGFKAMTFGQRIMRTETAAPAMLAAIQAIL
ncbi:MAG: 16S rRNA (uracil(1498)-N(3))-methyltransferase [Ghiorsea sp.]